LKWLQRGTFDSKDGEFEWVFKVSFCKLLDDPNQSILAARDGAKQAPCLPLKLISVVIVTFIVVKK
jgi:hypothetical protein